MKVECVVDGLGVPVLNAHRRAFPYKSSAGSFGFAQDRLPGFPVQSLTRNADQSRWIRCSLSPMRITTESLDHVIEIGSNWPVSKSIAESSAGLM